MNTLTIEGNVGKDPAVKQFDDGKLVTFSVATTERWTDRAGRAQERTDWHDVVVRGGLAETVVARVSKGARVLVIGEAQQRAYQGRDGQGRIAHEVRARTVALVLMPARGAPSERSEAPEPPTTTVNTTRGPVELPAAPPPPAAPEGDDDIPF